jgi:hypothetical protein
VRCEVRRADEDLAEVLDMAIRAEHDGPKEVGLASGAELPAR